MAPGVWLTDPDEIADWVLGAEAAEPDWLAESADWDAAEAAAAASFAVKVAVIRGFSYAPRPDDHPTGLPRLMARRAVSLRRAASDVRASGEGWFEADLAAELAIHRVHHVERAHADRAAHADEIQTLELRGLVAALEEQATPWADETDSQPAREHRPRGRPLVTSRKASLAPPARTTRANDRHGRALGAAA